MGCPDCGFAYSFFFRHQFHSAECPQVKVEEPDQICAGVDCGCHCGSCTCGI